MKKVFLLIMIFVFLSTSIFAKKLQDYPAIGDGIAVDADLLRIEDMSASAGSRTKNILLSSMLTYIFGGNRTMSGTLSMGANTISGSNITFTGGSIIGLTTLGSNLLNVDNIRVNGNTISSTDVNGNITFAPNGSGMVEVAASDFNYAGTTVTTTGTELNYSAGVQSQLSGLAENHSQSYVTATGAGVSLGGQEGTVNFDTTSNAITATAPLISTGKSEEYLCTLGTDGGNDVIIQDDVADAGFVKADGTTTGTTITLDDAGDFVLLKSCSYASGYWMILSGYGYTLNP